MKLPGILFIILLQLTPTLVSAQAVGLGQISRDLAEQQLSANGLKFSNIGEINGLSTIVAPGEGSSIQLQGPPDKLVGVTVRWNGRYSNLPTVTAEMQSLLGPIVPALDEQFFSNMQRSETTELDAEGISISSRFRRLGNQVSWEIQASLN